MENGASSNLGRDIAHSVFGQEIGRAISTDENDSFHEKTARDGSRFERDELQRVKTATTAEKTKPSENHETPAERKSFSKMNERPRGLG